MRLVELVRTFEGDRAVIDLLEVANDVQDVANAIKAAAVSYVNTPAGLQYAKAIHWNFNFGDAIQEIPAHLLRKHGVRVVDAAKFTTLVVKNDTILVSELDTQVG